MFAQILHLLQSVSSILYKDGKMTKQKKEPFNPTTKVRVPINCFVMNPYTTCFEDQNSWSHKDEGYELESDTIGWIIKN